ncbi:hypothetical protein LIER_15183 [Lithospermum erythrorhizon]|uniref:Uncharacterized protein n=1 Tax=Lithospermum erythrorhizon TaxID=34254 RepID=A0AAV3Q1W8_LITER
MRPTSMSLLTSASIVDTNSGRNRRWPCLMGREPFLTAKRRIGYSLYSDSQGKCWSVVGFNRDLPFMASSPWRHFLFFS